MSMVPSPSADFDLVGWLEGALVELGYEVALAPAFLWSGSPRAGPMISESALP